MIPKICWGVFVWTVCLGFWKLWSPCGGVYFSVLKEQWVKACGPIKPFIFLSHLIDSVQPLVTPYRVSIYWEKIETFAKRARQLLPCGWGCSKHSLWNYGCETLFKHGDIIWTYPGHEANKKMKKIRNQIKIWVWLRRLDKEVFRGRQVYMWENKSCPGGMLFILPKIPFLSVR